MPRRLKPTPQPAADAAPTTAELVIIEPPSLPGLVEVDAALLDEAVSQINRIYVSKGLEMYFAVGEYVLTTFFGGDPEAFHTRGKGHATFRALGERADLRLSHTAIYNAVAVVDQRRLLPDDLISALPFTHQRLLLPIKDEGAKVKLARKAVKDDLSSRELAVEVKREKARHRKGARPGRPNLPAFVKALGRLRSIREQAASEPITAEAFSTYGPEKARLLLADVEHWMRGLRETTDQVREALAAWSASTEMQNKPKAGPVGEGLPT
ncbi:MAG: hypothetical protein JXB39_16705 [Deltaproteobacteria bacterium]|nr:hypothetical protein [Deltaproteobacteria bacterium]